MTRRSYIPVLAIVFLLSALLCPRVADAWQCEGRICAVMLGGCCCTASGGDRHSQCDQPFQATAQSLGCSNGCGCVPVLSDCDAHDAVKPAQLLSFSPVAVLPAPLALYIAPALTKAAPLRVEARGPPRTPSALATASLRAPPAA